VPTLPVSAVVMVAAVEAFPAKLGHVRVFVLALKVRLVLVRTDWLGPVPLKSRL
jgi:hypothetical protein